MSTILAIATKNIKEAIRNWKSVSIVFVLPIVFMGIFSFAFGDNPQLTYDIGIIKSDTQAFTVVNEVLAEVTKPNSEELLFEIVEFEAKEQAQESLEDGEVTGYLQFESEDQQFSLTVSNLDQNSPAVIAIVREITDQIQGREPSTLQIETYEHGETEQEISGFQFLAPGLIIYGLIMLISQVAIEFAQITEKGHIFRYFTSQVKSWQIMSGYFLYYLVVGIIQVIVLIASALIFGMQLLGNPIHIFAVAIPCIFFTIGFGLLIGGLIDKPDPASNVATITGIILGFLSGAFIWNTRVLWLPTTQAAEAIIQIVQYGKGLNEISGNIAYVLLGSIVILALGTIVFHYKKLRNIN